MEEGKKEGGSFHLASEFQQVKKKVLVQFCYFFRVWIVSYQTVGCNSLVSHEINFVGRDQHFFPRIGKKKITVQHTVRILFYEMCVSHMYVSCYMYLYTQSSISYHESMVKIPWNLHMSRRSKGARLTHGCKRENKLSFTNQMKSNIKTSPKC